MLIEGAQLSSQKSIDVLNPATERAFARCYISSPADVDAAVLAASNAFPGWSQLPDRDRSVLVQEVGQLIEAHSDELKHLVMLESGKPIRGFMGIGAGAEVGASIAWTNAAATQTTPIEILQDDNEARVELHRRPIGVVGSITPWNWPLMIAIWHIMPALRVGNTVVIKPSLLTPVATARVVELANTVLPKGVLNLVHGGADIGSVMSRHPGIAKLIFTGSTPTGKRIMRDSADSLKRLTLELGGNDAGIVLPGTDITAIAERIFAASFANNGQTCAALKRLYVHESQYTDMSNAIVKIAENVIVGDSMDEKTDFGPMQNALQRDRVHELVEDAKARGGKVLCGGGIPIASGYYYPPTIISCVTDGLRIVDEEQFGPVLPVISYADVDDVIAQVNLNPCGLGGSIWSDDLDQAYLAAPRLLCGSVWINDHGCVRPDVPFGGIKQSGYGVQFGRDGLNALTAVQTIKLDKRTGEKNRLGKSDPQDPEAMILAEAR